MRFLSDENFRWDVVRFLEAQGHDIKISPSKSSDKVVINLAKKEKRILLTNDTDFSISLQFPPRQYWGILVFRIHPPSFEKYKKAIDNFISLHDTRFVKGKTFIIEENSFIEIE